MPISSLRKCKHVANVKAPAKRRKAVLSGQAYDTTTYYEINDIIGETRSKYLIDWKDNPVTGEIYSPTWEPKRNADAEAVADWNLEKARRATESRRRSLSSLLSEPISDCPVEKSIDGSIEQEPAEHIPKEDIGVLISQRSDLDKDEYILLSSAKASQDNPGRFDGQLEGTQSQQEHYLPLPKPRSNIFITDSQLLDACLSWTRSDRNKLDCEGVNENRRASGLDLASNSAEKQTEFVEGLEDNETSWLIGSQSALPSSVPCGYSQIGQQQDCFVEIIPSASQIKIYQSQDQNTALSSNERGVSKDEREFQTQVPVTFRSSGDLYITASGGQERTTGQSSKAYVQEPDCLTSSASITESTQSNSLAVQETTQVSIEIWQGGQIVSPLESVSHLTSVEERRNSQQSVVSTLSEKDPNTVTNPPLFKSRIFRSRSSSPVQSIEPAVKQIEFVDPGTTGIILNVMADQLSTGETFKHTTPADGSLPRSSSSNMPQRITASASPISPVNNTTSTAHSTAHPGGLSLREKLKQLREASAPIASTARRTSLTDAIASPTQSPASADGLSLKEKLRFLREGSAPAPVTTQTQTNMSLVSGTQSRSPSLSQNRNSNPSSTATPSGQGTAGNLVTAHSQESQGAFKGYSQRVVEAMSSCGMPLLGRMEFIVGLPMNTEVHNCYQQAVYNLKDAIEAFTRTENPPNASLIQQMKEIVQRLNNFCSHQDLEDEAALNARTNNTAESEAKWAETCSTKFEFLRHFLSYARHKEIKVAILARPGPIQDILETFLRAKKIVFARPTKLRFSDSSAKGTTSVTLIESGKEGESILVGRATVIIAMDDSFNASERHIQAFRQHVVRASQLGPVVRLVVANSPEHIQMCIPSNLSETLRMQVLVASVALSRQQVGVLPANYPSPAVAATQVVDSLPKHSLENYDKMVDKWKIPPLGAISYIGELLESQDTLMSTRASSVGSKRSALEAEHGQLQKRSRIDEAAHSESVNNEQAMLESSGMNLMNSGGGKAGQHLEQTPESRVQESEAIAQLNAKLEEQTNLEADLRRTIAATEDKLKEYIAALNSTRSDYESLLRDYRAMRKEKDEANAAIERLMRRQQVQAEESGRAKEERAQLEAELAKARLELQSSTVPGVAELEQARQEARQAAAAKEQLEQRLAALQQDFEFTRAQYQTASTAAAESATEVLNLRDQVEVLKRRASDEAAKLRELNNAGQVEGLMQTIKELKLTLAEREEQLRRKDEQTSGRLRTRAPARRASRMVSGDSSPDWEPATAAGKAAER